jgi:hypothetical protein
MCLVCVRCVCVFRVCLGCVSCLFGVCFVCVSCTKNAQNTHETDTNLTLASTIIGTY